MNSDIPKLDVGVELNKWLSTERHKIPNTMRTEIKSGTFPSSGNEFTKAMLEFDTENYLGTIELWGNLGRTYGMIDYAAFKKVTNLKVKDLDVIRFKCTIEVNTLSEFREKLTELLDDFILLVFKNESIFLTSPNLSPVPHGFFRRKSGCSFGIYASLNCGWGTKDNLAHVKKNRERVAQRLGTDGARLLSLHQVHGNKVITVNTPWRWRLYRPQADAMVTRMPGIALGILTADCVPVLFADPEHGIVGAAHAGWKGAVAGVLKSTVAAMCALGAKPATIAAAIGPCIAQPSYEVGAELRAQFPGFERYFIAAGRPGHFLFDIRGCVRELLRGEGITDINTLENDTYIEEDDFFSFRRATHRSEPDYGRQISAIMLTPDT